jgi:NADH dehydrogenase
MIDADVAITGANGHLGRRLLARLPRARAVVRSAAAAAAIAEGRLSADGRSSADTHIIDYTDAAAMQRAIAGCRAVVHLVGILKETRDNRYADAHEGTCTALGAAAAANGIDRIVYLSILGADSGSTNTCLASKGRAEAILHAASVPAFVLQVPMVLGEHDYASRALARRASSRVSVTLRSASREQPIYAGDVVDAIVAALELERPGTTIRLAGPESLSRRALIERAARVLGTKPRVLSLPMGLGWLMAGLFELVSANPPVTRAMLEVLDHDDDIDPQPACKQLDLALTALDATLNLVLKGS